MASTSSAHRTTAAEPDSNSPAAAAADKASTTAAAGSYCPATPASPTTFSYAPDKARANETAATVWTVETFATAPAAAGHAHREQSSSRTAAATNPAALKIVATSTNLLATGYALRPATGSKPHATDASVCSEAHPARRHIAGSVACQCRLPWRLCRPGYSRIPCPTAKQRLGCPTDEPRAVNGDPEPG